MAKVVMTADTILTALDSAKPTSYSGLYKAMGGRSKPAGSTIKTIKALMPDVESRIKANKDEGTTFQNSGKSKTSTGRKKWPLSKSNPYRESSNYHIALNILAAHPNGLPREKFESLYAKATRKSRDKARFDCAVVLSPKGESPTSERHRSCREGYGIRKEGSHVQIVLPN